MSREAGCRQLMGAIGRTPDNQLYQCQLLRLTKASSRLHIEQQLHVSSAGVFTRCPAAGRSVTSRTVGTSCHSIYQCSVQYGTGQYVMINRVWKPLNSAAVPSEGGEVALSQGRFTTPLTSRSPWNSSSSLGPRLTGAVASPGPHNLCYTCIRARQAKKWTSIHRPQEAWLSKLDAGHHRLRAPAPHEPC